MVMEYFPLGSLEKYLRENKKEKKNIPHKTLYLFGQQICQVGLSSSNLFPNPRFCVFNGILVITCDVGVGKYSRGTISKNQEIHKCVSGNQSPFFVSKSLGTEPPKIVCKFMWSGV